MHYCRSEWLGSSWKTFIMHSHGESLTVLNRRLWATLKAHTESWHVLKGWPKNDPQVKMCPAARSFLIHRHDRQKTIGLSLQYYVSVWGKEHSERDKDLKVCSLCRLHCQVKDGYSEGGCSLSYADCDPLTPASSCAMHSWAKYKFLYLQIQVSLLVSSWK